ncbi:MAG: hypothetical protein OHK0017_02710 [Patescibacteria group bacterium]
MSHMDKAYNPQEHEKDIYKSWVNQKAGYYQSLDPMTEKVTSFIMPPPNLTGSLHLGHVLEHSIYDAYLRYANINGSPAVFLPGVDHAGIQMEGTIEKKLKSEGTSKQEVGFEKFTEYTWKFATGSKDNIKMIAESVGELPAWDKMHFTMDDASTKAVRASFFDYWQRGWVYKNAQMINWSVGLQTAVSEVFGDIEWEERKDPLVTFEYEAAKFVFTEKMSHEINGQELHGPHPSLISLATGYLKPCSEWPRLQLSTVRMETKFTDVAIAMHPSKFANYFSPSALFYTDRAGFDVDLAQNFIDLIQQNQIEIFYHLPPLQSEDVKLILSDKVLEDFGTGILKITPGHDPFDYEFYLDAVDKGLLDGHKEIQQAVGRDGRLTKLCGEFAGLTVDEARPLVIKKLIETGYIPKRIEAFNGRTKTNDLPEIVRNIEDILEYDIDWEYSHNVQVCERSKTVIEPLVSTEWFVKMTAEDGIRDKALKKLNTTNEITFFPARFKDQAEDFLSKLRDWVVSRNLWWGHRIPVWYCNDCNPDHEFFTPDQFIENLDYDQNAADKAMLPPKGFFVWPNFDAPQNCPCCQSKNLVQEERVLDTWYSSSMWPLIMTGFDFEAYLKDQHVFDKYPYLTQTKASQVYQTNQPESTEPFIPVVFDFDGTLVDSWDATVMAHAEHTGQTSREVSEHLLNERLVKPRYTKDRIYTPEETEELMRFREEEYNRKQQYQMQAFQGFIDELKQLQQKTKVKFAIVSTAYQPVIDQFAMECGLEFTHVYGFGPNFSKERKMEQISQDWGVSMQNLYFVTDTIRDIIEAQEYLDPNKILGCGWGFHGFDRLKSVLPEAQIMNSFSDIQTLVAPQQLNNKVSLIRNNLHLDQADFDPRTKFLQSLNGELAVSDLKLFQQAYPSQMLTCASEIFNIWVCRMIMLGYHFTGQPPFKNMFVHAVVRDEKGRKFSKSLGNGIEPQELLDKYSADSVRMALNSQIVPGRDILMSRRTAEELVIKWRNFGNKLWNIARFVNDRLAENENITESEPSPASVWVYNKLVELQNSIELDMNQYRLGQVMDRIYEFTWNDLADWYIEYLKTDSGQLSFAKNKLILPLIQLLHPFVPFETELLWSEIGNSRTSILMSNIEKLQPLPENLEFETIKEFVVSFRKLRGLYRIDPVTKTQLFSNNSILNQYRDFLGLIARVEVLPENNSPESANFYSEKWFGIDFKFDLLGLISDPGQEIIQSEKDLLLAHKDIAKLESLLGNEGFMQKASEETIVKTKNDLTSTQLKVGQLKEKINWLKKHQL